MILELLTQHQRLCMYATVSKEWQIMIEKKTFHRLKLKQSCLDDFERLVKRQRGLVRHVWLNIELKRYTCRCCRQWESMTWTHQNNKIIVPAIAKLFSILSTWKPAKEGLTLELNAYSPSDPEHWFKNCYFGASGEDEILGSEYPSQDNTAGIHDPEHGWRDGVQVSANSGAIRRPYAQISIKFQDELPQVKAVTKFLLRRQCRRQWAPATLWYLWSKLPRLEDIVYEPWQLFEKDVQDAIWERGMLAHLRPRDF